MSAIPEQTGEKTTKVVTRGVWAAPEKSQNIEFSSNTGLDPLKNHKATKPAFNVRPSSARQRKAFYWRTDDRPAYPLTN